ncbi:hypothetical protein [Spiribacter salinus]|uniref:hypothetical protein n=1 Tax=Spiribacter salinus TaxID=1335746 RepID=UPI00039CABDD|nr:hypothetical protein [Spiribacter salinus]
MAPADEDFRAAGFAHVAALTAQHGVLSSRIIANGFQFQGQRIPLVNPQQGLFQAPADALSAVDPHRDSPKGREGLV